MIPLVTDRSDSPNIMNPLGRRVMTVAVAVSPFGTHPTCTDAVELLFFRYRNPEGEFTTETAELTVPTVKVSCKTALAVSVGAVTGTWPSEFPELLSTSWIGALRLMLVGIYHLTCEILES